jgi:hypothetical protein
VVQNNIPEAPALAKNMQKDPQLMPDNQAEGQNAPGKDTRNNGSG